MAKKKKEKEKTLLNKFSRRVYGLLLIAAGWLLLAAVCFYSPADSSFNLAADNIRNLFGYPGASAAAVILTFSGLALPLFVIPVMVWGYRLCLLEDIRLFWLHFIVWLLGIAAAMMCFDFVRFAMPLGGVIGRMLNTVCLRSCLNFLSAGKPLPPSRRWLCWRLSVIRWTLPPDNGGGGLKTRRFWSGGGFV